MRLFKRENKGGSLLIVPMRLAKREGRKENILVDNSNEVGQEEEKKISLLTVP
jgi:hypothetical protein